MRGVVAVGMDMESNQKTLAIAREQAGYVHAALGYHPWEINGEEADRNPPTFDNVGGCVR
jgi:Tat protein secretion system quality control protein TatD with DNase activity